MNIDKFSKRTPTRLDARFVRPRYLPCLNELIKQHTTQGSANVRVRCADVGVSETTFLRRLHDAVRGLINGEVAGIRKDEIEVPALRDIWPLYKADYDQLDSGYITISPKHPLGTTTIGGFNSYQLRSDDPRFEECLHAFALLLSSYKLGRAEVVIIGMLDSQLLQTITSSYNVAINRKTSNEHVMI